MNFLDSSSKSSGLEGGFETRTSSTGSMIPCPKKCAHTKLAKFLAKNGFWGEASQSARTSRRSAPRGISGVSSPRNFWGHGFFVYRMINLSASSVINNIFAGIGPSFATYLAEERGKRIVFILGPTVKRVIVTLCTLQAHSHKDLSNIFSNFQVVPFHLVVIGSRDW